MRNSQVARHYEAARIYKQYYRHSVNPLRLIKSVLAVLLTGNAPAARHYHRKK